MRIAARRTQLHASFPASRREMIADLVSKQKLPAIYSTSTFVRSGGLIGYGFDRADLFHTAISSARWRAPRHEPR